MIGKISWRIILILSSAIMLSIFTYSYLNGLQETATVYIYSEDLSLREEITADHIEEVTVEVNAVQALATGNIRSPEEVIGGITLREIDAGEIVRLDEREIVFPEDRKLYLQASGELDLSAFVPADKRLISVALDPSSAVDFKLKASDWVDVIYTRVDPIDNELITTDILLQQLEVFDVENLNITSDLGKDGVIQHVTLLVTPQEAVQLAHAKDTGNIDLILNPWNGEQVEVEQVRNIQ